MNNFLFFKGKISDSVLRQEQIYPHNQTVVIEQKDQIQFYDPYTDTELKQEPQGALIAHLSTMSTSVKS